MLFLSWSSRAQRLFPEILHSSSALYSAGTRGNPYHGHPVYHILLYNSGKGHLLYEGRRIDVCKGMLLFISPDRKHAFIPHREFNHNYLEITFGLYDEEGRPASISFEELFSLLGMAPPPLYTCLHQADYIEVEKALLEFTRVGYNPPKILVEKNRLAIALSSFLFRLGDLLRSADPGEAPALAADQTVQLVLNRINRQYDKPLRLKDLAALAGCSREHLSRKFKQATGHTIVEQLNALRFELARKMLKTSGLPIKEICAKVGIEDIYYFSKQFKKRFGLPPARFARQTGYSA